MPAALVCTRCSLSVYCGLHSFYHSLFLSLSLSLSSQAMVCITAGCCMAIGLRYAGTSNQQAHTLLVSHVMSLIVT